MARIYSKSVILSSVLEMISEVRLDRSLWRTLSDLGISRTKLTRRGCRSGQRKVKLSTTHSMESIISTGGILQDFSPFSFVSNCRDHLYFSLDNTLNIQVDASAGYNRAHRSLDKITAHEST